MAKVKSKNKQTAKNILEKKRAASLTESDTSSPYENYIYLGIILIAVLFFFREGVFGGKVFANSDNIAFESFRNFLSQAKENGIFPLWVPFIFMGMPNFPIIAYNPRVYDFFYYIWDRTFAFITGADTNMLLPIVIFYVIFGISLYIYSNYKFRNRMIALFVALCGTFATDFIQRIIVGHNTKVLSLMFFPLMLYIVDRIMDENFDKRKLFSYHSLFYLFFLSLILHIQLNSNHIQMIFYSYLFIGIYILYIFIYKLIKKINYASTVKAGITFIFAALISVAMNADVIMTMKEYNKYSMRGEPGIEAKIDPSKSGSEPLDYQYATNWSFSPGEVITFLLPYYYGFGDVEVRGQKQNLYWGQMPFTTSPMYFGVIVFILAVIGIIYGFKRNFYVQALTVIAVMFLILSFGRTFPLLFDLFFFHFPFFSSFRAPVMIHHFMDIAFVILAGFGLKSIIDVVRNKESLAKFKKICYVFFGIAGLMFLISIAGFEGSYQDSVSTGPLSQKLMQQGANPQQITQYTQQIASIAYENTISDMRLHAFFIAAVTGLAFLFISGKFSLKFFLIGTILISFFDLWNVNTKTLHWDPAGQKEIIFADTDYSNWLLQNAPDTYEYRVAEFSNGRLATSNLMANYGLHAFNGYHGAKIRIYQDAIDIAGGENPLLLSLGGVKYILSDSQLEDPEFAEVFRGRNMIIYENKNYIPKAFFVDEYQVQPGINILNYIRDGNFDPLKTAFVENEIYKNIEPAGEGATVTLTDAGIHHLTYNVNATGDNMLVFSEIYLPLGWKVFIDGLETEIYKTNYFMRSIVVPAGQHTIEMKYEPEVYYTGKSISIAANIFMAIILIAGAGGYFIQRRRPNVPVKNDVSEE
jgi:hypothetical protein